MIRTYIGRADTYFTLADERNGYVETRRHLAGYDDAMLIREYKDAVKAGFDRLFGHNARQFGNLVVDELTARGIAEIPNILGAYTVTRFVR